MKRLSIVKVIGNRFWFINYTLSPITLNLPSIQCYNFKMKRTYVLIFFVSCSLLIYEVALTRFFAIHFWYHFAFMVISIAMLGIGTAGTVLAIFSAGSQCADQHIEKKASFFGNVSNWVCSESNIPFFACCAGISIVLSYLAANNLPFDPIKFSWEKWQILYLLPYCTVLSVPFFFSALLIASILLNRSAMAKSVYCADLMGAGLGSISVLGLLNISGPEHPVIYASILCLAGTFISGGRKMKTVSLLLITIHILLLTAGHNTIEVKMSPYKNLSTYLKYPGAEHIKTYNSSYARVDVFKSPAVRFAPGLSLTYLDPLPEQTGLAVDGDRITVVTDSTDMSKLKFLQYLPSSAAHEIKEHARVLVLDPGGGLHALMAGYYDAEEVHTVEINPLLYKIVKNDFNQVTGGLYREKTWTGLGRNVLKHTDKESYDIIDMPMTSMTVSGSFGISEDYKYTVNAFEHYISALKKDGIISITLYLLPPPRTEFRLIATMRTAFERSGIHDISRRIVVIRSWDSMTILAGKSPFTDKELAKIREFSRTRRFDILYQHGIKKEDIRNYIKSSSDKYYEGLANLLDTEKSSQFINNYLFNIRPVQDENPFFNHFVKFANINAIYDVMGRNWLFFLDEGYLLPLILISLIILSVIIISLPAASKSVRTNLKDYPHYLTISTMLFFAMIGLGFMFLEVSLIQKSILLLENPSYSFALILTSILISSGAGSFMSRQYPFLSSPVFVSVLACLIVAYNYVYPFMLDRLTSESLLIKIIFLSLSVLPIGFLMGIPFPTGIGLLGQRYTSLIPWSWAVNACFSILAPVLTITIALTAGFNTVMLLSSVAYVFASISLRKIKQYTHV